MIPEPGLLHATGGERQKGKDYISPLSKLPHIHITTRDMSGIARSPMLTSLGQAHLQLLQCAGPDLLSTAAGYGWGQIFCFLAPWSALP